MERIQRLGSALRSATVAVSTTRPTAAGDGVDISALFAAEGGGVPPQMMVYLKGDGTSTGVGNPTGGTSGPEVWSYMADDTGTLRWCLVGFLNGKNAIALPASATAGEYCEMLTNTLALLGTRVAIAGAPATGGGVTFFVEGIARDQGLGM